MAPTPRRILKRVRRASQRGGPRRSLTHGVGTRLTWEYSLLGGGEFGASCVPGGQLRLHATKSSARPLLELLAYGEGVAAAWRCGSGTSAIPVPSRTSTGPPLQKFLAALRRPRGMFPAPCRRLALRPSNGARLPALARPSAPPPACCTSLRRPRQCGLARRHPPLTGVPAPPHHPTRPPLALAVQDGEV